MNVNARTLRDYQNSLTKIGIEAEPVTKFVAEIVSELADSEIIIKSLREEKYGLLDRIDDLKNELEVLTERLKAYETELCEEAPVNEMSDEDINAMGEQNGVSDAENT